jgi:hypothetical protein
VCGQPHGPAALPSGEEPRVPIWQEVVDPRAGQNDVEERKFLILPGLELRPLGRPARTQSLYWTRYPDSWKGLMSLRKILIKKHCGTEKKTEDCRSKVKVTTLKFRNWSHSITYEPGKAYAVALFLLYITLFWLWPRACAGKTNTWKGGDGNLCLQATQDEATEWVGECMSLRMRENIDVFKHTGWECVNVRVNWWVWVNVWYYMSVWVRVPIVDCESEQASSTGSDFSGWW